MSNLTGRVAQLVPEAKVVSEVEGDHGLTIYGPPGTGKTTALLRLVDAHVEAGIRPENLMVATFTRNARTEARSRLIQQGAEEEDLDWVSTIHSACYRLAEVQQEQVLQPDHLRRFGADNGWEFTFGQRDVEDPYGGAAQRTYGDWLLTAEELRRARLLTFEQAAELFEVPDNGAGWDAEEARAFSEALRDFKRQSELVDYSDMLELVLEHHLAPPCTHYFVDEAQDLSPLQWAVIRQWSDPATRLFAFGDDDQAIYRWGGADPEVFNGLPMHKMVLSHSWRLPSAVHGEANRIVNRVLRRVAKIFEPHAQGGDVLKVYSWEDVDLPSDGVSTFLLARNRMHLEALRRVLDERALPYSDRTSHQGVPDPTTPRSRAARWLLDLHEGGVLMNRGQMRTVRRMMGTHGRERFWPEDTTPKQSVFRVQDLPDCGCTPEMIQILSTDPLTVLPHGAYLSELVRRYGRKVLEEKPQYELSTIHGAKGEEAERVAVCTAMSRQTYQGYLDNPEDEHRVMYVGATRARQSLTWVDLYDARGRRYDI